MEGAYKLSDQKLITQDAEYATLGPIGIVAWDQKENTQLVTNHEFPALVSKLPESNLAETEMNLSKPSYASKVEDRAARKCYRCGSADHLRPDCPQSPKYGERSGGPPPTYKSEERVRKALASWKYIQGMILRRLAQMMIRKS
jgi:hypothetical protein